MGKVILAADSPTKFHLVDWTPPSSVSVYFTHKRAPYAYSLVINIGEDGILSVDVVDADGSDLMLEGDMGTESCDSALILHNVIAQLDDL